MGEPKKRVKIAVDPAESRVLLRGITIDDLREAIKEGREKYKNTPLGRKLARIEQLARGEEYSEEEKK
jgi:hypothetical protein